MRNFNQIYIMLVFGVKYRLGLISPKWANQLYAVIGNKLKEYGCRSIIINGVRDHIHILLSSNGTHSLSNIVKEIKIDSTNWINKNKLTLGNFRWQEGSGRFSYSYGQLEVIKRYIANQASHHNEISFRNEMERLMTRTGHIPEKFDLPEPLE